MASQGDFSTAMANRSLRNIRSELEFLADSAVITQEQLSSILSQLPVPTEGRAPIPLAAAPVVQSPVSTPSYDPPTTQLANTAISEKAPIQPQYTSPVPPPAYAQTPPVLSTASALYAYAPTDAGDLALQPQDNIQVLEHMNNDWWRGRNERTGLEGIFPRSYVKVLDEKAALSQPTNYGNMPLDVSQSGGPVAANDPRRSKFEEHGKKFGKKMGNAAIFGAGATIGSNIVNGIF